MPIRKGRLWRNCRKCNRSFEPTGKSSWICNKCKPTSYLDMFLKLKKQNDKKKKYKKTK